MAAPVVADTHALLWMLDGTLPERSQSAAQRLGDALNAKALHVSIGSFLDLRYLVDSGRRPARCSKMLARSSMARPSPWSRSTS